MEVASSIFIYADAMPEWEYRASGLAFQRCAGQTYKQVGHHDYLHIKKKKRGFTNFMWSSHILMGLEGQGEHHPMQKKPNVNYVYGMTER